MNQNQLQILKLLEELPDSSDFELVPATSLQITVFKERAFTKKVPENVITQLIELYKVADGYVNHMVIGFINCDDETIFEWWGVYQELWIGQRDLNTLRWANGTFCLGDASSTSYDESYESPTLVGLIEICRNEMLRAID
ncbi:hypothetical protein HCX49_04390 [Sphingobacterium kitahiroshimense]|uniref:hypothetical protein n=1 Tax=Sphingobacterium sp. B16(2022) TaxID=2914044 RepID=UPI00143C2F20|nr:hypothetical protein [Sphingobacterium sp. B16(2022)]NJI72436.1 hypothetical protein [Sphingobacterium sp. B16(2022)]